MKTRFSSLVNVKKNKMQKSERALQEANRALQNAKQALADSFLQLQQIETPQHGKIAQLLENRTLLERQRALIRHNEEWIRFEENQVDEKKNILKEDMIEFEKFKYLEFKEVEKLLKEIKVKEAKDLDEVALMTFINGSKAAS
ncbi:flagellar export protein FliJ [Sulfurimonas sp.]|uniref:flagellar export protein FliJ n=1 Tax=Sulfurimonas sp. TaxID=2022749 RepID=UPI00262F4ED6|nr:flagellar export protein FliJ [Sulfurimonas sp.]